MFLRGPALLWFPQAGGFHGMSQMKQSRKSPGLSPVHPAAAAIDIGAAMHVAAVGPDRDKEPVRTLQTSRMTFTGGPGGRPTSATRNGCNACTNTDRCAPVSGPRPKLPGCAPTSGEGAAARLRGGAYSAHLPQRRRHRRPRRRNPLGTERRMGCPARPRHDAGNHGRLER
jgi:hypothetical protein